jgi:hypothetical protein
MKQKYAHLIVQDVFPNIPNIQNFQSPNYDSHLVCVSVPVYMCWTKNLYKITQLI